MLRRWNLTIILIITALVLGFVCGYIYRDQFSWLLPNIGQLERTEPDIANQIFRTEISEILQPDSGIEASSGNNAVYSFTGNVILLSGDTITIEQPSDQTDTIDAIDFLLTDDTIYVTASAAVDENGLPALVESELTRGELAVGDIVTVYTVEDMLTATDRHVTKVQKLINNN